MRLGECTGDHLPGRAANGGEQGLAVRFRSGLRGGTATAAGGAEQAVMVGAYMSNVRERSGPG